MSQQMQKLLSLILLTVLPLVANAAPPKPQPATYQSILPVLRSRCIVCHSESNLSNTLVSGGLALDSFGAIIRGSATSKGPRSIVIPRKSIDSEIVKRLLATSPSKMMPKGGPPLSPAQIALFQKWIDAGATAGVATKSSGMVMNKAALPKLANIQLVTIPTLMNGGSKDQPISLSMQIGPLPIMTSLSFSPDGKFIAVAGYRAVTLWDTTTGMPTCITNLPGSLMSLAYSPDGSK